MGFAFTAPCVKEHFPPWGSAALPKRWPGPPSAAMLEGNPEILTWSSVKQEPLLGLRQQHASLWNWLLPRDALQKASEDLPLGAGTMPVAPQGGSFIRCGLSAGSAASLLLFLAF